MALFGLRFDLRNPDIAGTTMAERYEAALDMAEWADRLGFVVIVLSEHHGSGVGEPAPVRGSGPAAARVTPRREGGLFPGSAGHPARGPSPGSGRRSSGTTS